MKCDRKKLLVYAMFIILAIFGILFLINYKNMEEIMEKERSIIEGNVPITFEDDDENLTKVKKYLSKGNEAENRLLRRKHAFNATRGQEKVAYGGQSAQAGLGFPEYSSVVKKSGKSGKSGKQGFIGNRYREGFWKVSESSQTDPGSTCAALSSTSPAACIRDKNIQCKLLDKKFIKGDPTVCSDLIEEENKFCGILVKPEKGIAVAYPGVERSTDNPNPQPLTGPNLEGDAYKNWIPPGKNIKNECERTLERLKCAKVKKCDKAATLDEAPNLCAWCPIEGRSFVYDKIHEQKWKKNKNYKTTKKLNNGKTVRLQGQFVPKYPNLDVCDWGKINGKPGWLGWGSKKGFDGPMLRGNNDCTRLNADFPCLVNKNGDVQPMKTGKHSKECKQDMWESADCTGNFESRLSSIKNKQ